MCENNDKSPRDFLLDLVTSDINLARAFTAVSKSAYQLGKPEQGDFARLKAIQLYSEATKLAPELPESHREDLQRELQALSTTINWLFVQPPAGGPAAESRGERLAIEPPPIALEES